MILSARPALALLMCIGLRVAAEDVESAGRKDAQGNPGRDGDKTPLGSPEFRPAPDRPVGWRGDGNGKYPAATPPIHWGRVDKKMLGLKCLAAVPGNASGKDATSVPMGFFSEWLVAGPIRYSGTDTVSAITGQLLPGEADFAPVAGDRLGDTTWKRVKADDSYVDLWKAVGPMTNTDLAYAQSCLYVENPVKVYVHLKHVQGAAFWFNGKPMYSNKEMQSWWHYAHGPVLPLELKAGWNRFLFKVSPETKQDGWKPQCYLRCRFWSAEEPREYREQNIAWTTPMPGLSLAMPIIVGDSVFTTAYPYNLVCVDKNTGKVRWVRSNSMYDALTPEERKANPEAVAKLDGMAAKRDAYYRAYVEGTQPGEQAVTEQMALEKDMDKLVLETWKGAYKKLKEATDGEQWCVPTPVSDGQWVYVWNTFGVRACFDPAGKRRWIRYSTPLPQHHNWFNSPNMADGRMVIYDGNVTSFNPADGLQVWQTDGRSIGYLNCPGQFGSFTTHRLDGTDYLCGGYGNVFIRGTDGQVNSNKFQWGFALSPVIDNDRAVAGPSVYDIKVSRSGVSAVSRGQLKPLAGSNPINPPGYQDMFRNYSASSLLHEGLAYQIRDDGVLSVFDTEQMAVVYQKELGGDINSFAANPWCNWWGSSPTLAGPYIYAMSPTGITIVFKPGRQYEEVARNKVEHISKVGRMLGLYSVNPYSKPYVSEQQESTIASTPVFEGRRMYYRGQENLYCIEETK